MRHFASEARRWFCIAAILGILGATAGIAWAGTTLHVDCVGDSIVVGGTDGPLNDFTFGYRSFLYTRLVDAGYNIQFVGTSPWPWNLYSPSLPITGLDLRDVDQDYHQGYGGATTGIILNGGYIYGTVPNVTSMMNTDDPDVVLLMIGINDIAQGSATAPAAAKSNLFSIVQNIVDAKPDAQVIVAQITPYASYTGAIVDYNDYIKYTMVPHFAGLGNHVTTVDQYSNFLTPDGAIDSSLFANGINHPGPTGYGRMAETWFEGIVAVVPEPSSACLLACLGSLLAAFACRRAASRD